MKKIFYFCYQIRITLNKKEAQMQNIMLFRLLLVSLTTPEKKALAFLSHLFAIFLFFLLFSQGRAWHAFKERKRGDTCFFFFLRGRRLLFILMFLKQPPFFQRNRVRFARLSKGGALVAIFSREPKAGFLLLNKASHYKDALLTFFERAERSFLLSFLPNR